MRARQRLGWGLLAGMILVVAGGVGLWAYKESQRPRPAGAKRTRDDPVEVKQRFLAEVKDSGPWEITYFRHHTEFKQNRWSLVVKREDKRWEIDYLPALDSGNVAVFTGEEIDPDHRFKWTGDGSSTTSSPTDALALRLYHALRLAVWEF